MFRDTRWRSVHSTTANQFKGGSGAKYPIIKPSRSLLLPVQTKTRTGEHSVWSRIAPLFALFSRTMRQTYSWVFSRWALNWTSMQRIFQRRKHGNILGKKGSVFQHLVLKNMEKQRRHLCVMLSKDKDRCPLWLAPQPPHFQQVLRDSQALPRIIWKCLLCWLYFICSPIQVLTRPNLAWFLISQNSELLLLILLLLLCIQSSLAIDFLTFFLHIYNVQWCLQWISCMINSIHDSFE